MIVIVKDTTFFLIVGLLAGVSLTCGLLGWRCSKRIKEKSPARSSLSRSKRGLYQYFPTIFTLFGIKHGDSATFNDLLEDNAPKSPASRELWEDFARDCGWSGDDYPY